MVRPTEFASVRTLRVATSYLFFGFLILTAGGVSAPAVAADCSSVSPAKLSAEGLYGPGAEPVDLTSNQIKAYEKLIKGMEGRWVGEDIGFVCEQNIGRGRSRPPVLSIVSQGRLESPTRFVLDSTISSRDTVSQELLRLELRGKRLWVNQGDVGLTTLTDRVLEFGYKLRRGGAITELYWRIEVAGRTLTIEHEAYGNGALSGSSTWKLKKPH